MSVQQRQINCNHSLRSKRWRFQPVTQDNSVGLAVNGFLADPANPPEIRGWVLIRNRRTGSVPKTQSELFYKVVNI